VLCLSFDCPRGLQGIHDTPCLCCAFCQNDSILWLFGSQSRDFGDDVWSMTKTVAATTV
jgi:hypothetical protein